MAANPMANLVQYLRKVAILDAGDSLDDALLLGAFVGERDEAAFEVLMRRHGPMVSGVCRRILGNVHDAADAFQATFLVLVRRAASIRDRATVGNWLYRVAYRTALESRRTKARRGTFEKQVLNMPQPQIPMGESWHELEQFLDHELNRLPNKYRLPVILCDLEGRTRKHVARQLRIPEGTLSNRLARARKLLAKRLTRQGFGLSAVALAALIGQHASAAVPLSVVTSTVRMAAALMAGEIVASGLVPVQIAALTKGVLQAMVLTKIKIVGAVLLTLCVLGLGTGKIVSQVVFGKSGAGANVQLVPGKPDTIEVPKETQVQLGAQIGRIKARAEDKQLMPPMIGALAWDLERLFTIRSRYPGEVAEVRGTLDADAGGKRTRPLRYGDKVKQGDLLAVVWSQPLGAAKGALVDALCALRFSQAYMKRLEELEKMGALPLATLKAAERQMQSDTNNVLTSERALRMWRLADPEIDELKAEANLIHDQKKERKAADEMKWARAEIRVPWFDKANPQQELMILETKAVVDERVDPSTSPPLFKLVDTSRLQIRVQPPEQYLPAIREALREPKEHGRLQWEVRAQSDPPNTPPRKLDIGYIVPGLEPNQKSPTVVGYLPNLDGRYFAGQAVVARILLPAPDPESSVPASALGEEKGKTDVADTARLVQCAPKSQEAWFRTIASNGPETRITRIPLNQPGLETVKIINEKGDPLGKARVLRVDQRDIYIQLKKKVYSVHIGDSLAGAIGRDSLGDAMLKELDLLKLVKN